MKPDVIERNAAIQNRYREINEHLAHVYNQFLDAAEGDQTVELFDLFCECGQQPFCGERVKVSPVTYERFWAESTTFVLSPGHGIAAVEEVIERGEGVLITRNLDRAAAIAPPIRTG